MFLLRDGVLSRLNADHSMRTVLAQLVEAGRMTADQAAADTSRNALRSALSGDEIPLIDQSHLAQLLRPGDILVLASDGLDTLDDDEIARLAREASPRGPQAIVDALLKAVDAAKRDRQDNTSVVAYLHGAAAAAAAVAAEVTEPTKVSRRAAATGRDRNRHPSPRHRIFRLRRADVRALAFAQETALPDHRACRGPKVCLRTGASDRQSAVRTGGGDTAKGGTEAGQAQTQTRKNATCLAARGDTRRSLVMRAIHLISAASLAALLGASAFAAAPAVQNPSSPARAPAAPASAPGTPAPATPAAPQPSANGSILELIVDGNPAKSGTALVVTSDGWLLANSSVVGDSTKLEIVDNTGTRVPAQFIAHDRDRDLAILRINMSGLTPAKFAGADPSAGVGVTAAGWWSHGGVAPARNEVSGAIGDPSTVKSGGRSIGVFTHNALFGRGGYGAPLLDTCGTVLAITRTDPAQKGGLFSSKSPLDPPATYAIAAGAKDVTAYLSESGVPFQSGSDCAQTIAGARATADKLAKEAEDAKKRADKLAGDAKAAAEKAAADAKKAADDAAKALAAMENRQREAQAQLAQKRSDLATALAEVKNSQNLLLWGGVGGTVLVLGLAGASFVTVRSSRKKRLTAEQSAQDAKEKMERATVPPAGAFDLLLEGKDPSGAKVALKIPAIALGSEEGAVIGRNPKDAQFVINRESLSRRHCRLFVKDGALFVEDFGSTNGTKLNGQPVTGEAVKISPNDKLMLADLELTLKGATL